MRKILNKLVRLTTMSDKNTGDNNTGDWNTGNWNTGDFNTGSWNTGDFNTGSRNAGDDNLGDGNAGSLNTGDFNTGSWNTGSWNTGSRNAGDDNLGDGNAGSLNTGDRNTGSWNTGSWNAGYFNTNEPETVRLFNKEWRGRLGGIHFPILFFNVRITEWIEESVMTEEEKAANPTYKTTGGYLKQYEYKEAWRRAWDNADLEDRKKTLNLPNFDRDIFLEITGIDVDKEFNTKKEVVRIGELEFDKQEVEDRLKGLKPINNGKDSK